MATTIKKGANNTKTKPRRAVIKASLVKEEQKIAQLRQELAESLRRNNATAKKLQRQLDEAVEQQTAKSEILQVIASSPTDIRPVLDVAKNAAHLCNANNAQGKGSKFTFTLPVG